MSLDLYINSKTPVIHRGTGVYVRENGETKELQTKEEVLRYFPDVNPDEIEETSYEDDTYFHMNLTHNLTKMAGECKAELYFRGLATKEGSTPTLYDLLWHPEETLGIKEPTIEYMQELVSCYKRLLKHPDYYRKYNPENGWGSYDGLVMNLKKYIEALMAISDKFEEYTIESDT